MKESAYRTYEELPLFPNAEMVARVLGVSLSSGYELMYVVVTNSISLAQALLARLVKAQHEIDAITATENFILGFRLGVRLMVECMDEDDGDIRNGGE